MQPTNDALSLCTLTIRNQMICFLNKTFQYFLADPFSGNKEGLKIWLKIFCQRVTIALLFMDTDTFQ